MWCCCKDARVCVHPLNPDPPYPSINAGLENKPKGKEGFSPRSIIGKLAQDPLSTPPLTFKPQSHPSAPVRRTREKTRGCVRRDASSMWLGLLMGGPFLLIMIPSLPLADAPSRELEIRAAFLKGVRVGGRAVLNRILHLRSRASTELLGL